MRKRKWLRWLFLIGIAAISLFLLLNVLGSIAHAAGLVDDTIDNQNLYSMYSLDHYQLDFFVDDSWDWLPWNWSDGIGKNVMYGLYAITNFVWTVSLYISNATGYVIQEAYKLDFISDTAQSIGKNIQTLAGVTQSGFSTEGFYVGFLLIFILIVGIYVAYVGLIKRESSKAIHAVMNFVTVFLVSASFIVFAPDYITKINDFSSDISSSALSLGTKIVAPDTDTEGQDSVDTIRDSLFAIQVEQPWLLLQYGDSDKEELGSDRVDQLVSVDPDDNNGEDREKVVKGEIEDQKNKNMTITKTMDRLGTVVFLFIFDLGISIFIFLLTGIMIFSQILFIIYAMFLPISFLMSMLPTYEGMAKKAIEKLFNTIMLRAGITLVITTAFSISSMFYSLSDGYPFFMVAFLQIVTFAGVYSKLGDLMSMFGLQGADSQHLGRGIISRPRAMANRSARKLQQKLGRALTLGGVGAAFLGNKKKSNDRGRQSSPSDASELKQNMGERMGRKLATISDTPNKIKDKAQTIGENAKNLPVNARYAVMDGLNRPKKTIQGMKRGVMQQKQENQGKRDLDAARRRQTVAEKRKALEQSGVGQKSKSQSSKQRGNIQQKTMHTVSEPTNQSEEKTAKSQKNRENLSSEKSSIQFKKADEINRRLIKPAPKHQGPILPLKEQKSKKKAISGKKAGGKRET